MQFEKDIASPNSELFLATRSFLLSFEGIIETKKTRITTYGNAKGGICHMRTMPHGIDIGFLKGAKMKDSSGLLTGTGKAIRVLPLKELDKDKIRYYIEQALEINARK